MRLSVHNKNTAIDSQPQLNQSTRHKLCNCLSLKGSTFLQNTVNTCSIAKTVQSQVETTVNIDRQEQRATSDKAESQQTMTLLSKLFMNSLDIQFMY